MWCAGLGKTTLAHVVARHCGYRTVEINASDERTAATLQARITDAVQMQSVLGAGRPNCVIIDEVDGATGTLPTLHLLDCYLRTLVWEQLSLLDLWTNTGVQRLLWSGLLGKGPVRHTTYAIMKGNPSHASNQGSMCITG